MSENLVAVTQAMQVAWVEYDPPFAITDGMTAARVSTLVRDAFMSGYLAQSHAAGLEREADGAPGGGSVGEDVATLDVFLSAYSQYSDGELVASVILPTDDLLTLGELRRILAALTKPTPPASVSGEVVVVPREPTEAMKQAGWDVMPGLIDYATAAYKAMLAAAPEAATPSAMGGVDRMREALIQAGGALNGCEYATVGDQERAGRALAFVRAALATGETSPEKGAGE